MADETRIEWKLGQRRMQCLRQSLPGAVVRVYFIFLTITAAALAATILIFWLATGLLPMGFVFRAATIVLLFPLAIAVLILLASHPWSPPVFCVTAKGGTSLGYWYKWKHVKWCQILPGPVDLDRLKAYYGFELPADGETDLLVFWRDRLLCLPLPHDPVKQQKVLRVVSDKKPVEQADPYALQQWYEARHREKICVTPFLGLFAMAMVFLMAADLLKEHGFPMCHLVVGGIGMVLMVAMAVCMVIAAFIQFRRPKLRPPRALPSD
jgi:hypothetical protein